MPEADKFPYTVRVVSEITESNGSSSMASVCGASLALMDAGVPIKAAVAGIAMGLVKEGDNYVVLSDILGDEDHLGDMDFKVAGSRDGISALQMDIKIEGITKEIMQVALNQAKGARLHILGVMEQAINAEIQSLIAACQRCPAKVVLVTNEVGMGIVPESRLARHFRDIAGRVNQQLAAAANEVWLVVSGIGVKIK